MAIIAPLSVCIWNKYKHIMRNICPKAICRETERKWYIYKYMSSRNQTFCLRTPLAWMRILLRKNKISIIQSILDSCPMSNSDIHSLCVYAIQLENIDAFRILYKDKCQDAIMFAISGNGNSHVAIVDWILKKTPMDNIAIAFCMELAISKYNNNIAKHLYDLCRGQESFDMVIKSALRNGNKTFTNYLLDNSQEMTYDDSILMASIGLDLDIVKRVWTRGNVSTVLLEEGLDRALLCGRIDTAKYFVSIGATGNRIRPETFTQAVFNGHYDLLEYIVLPLSNGLGLRDTACLDAAMTAAIQNNDFSGVVYVYDVLGFKTYTQSRFDAIVGPDTTRHIVDWLSERLIS